MLFYLFESHFVKILGNFQLGHHYYCLTVTGHVLATTSSNEYAKQLTLDFTILSTLQYTTICLLMQGHIIYCHFCDSVCYLSLHTFILFICLISGNLAIKRRFGTPQSSNEHFYLLVQIKFLNLFYIYSEIYLNRTFSKHKTCLIKTDFTVPSTKCLCNLNLCEPNTCLN